MGFQVQHAKFRIGFAKWPQEHGAEVHHEESQIGRIGDRPFFDIHKVIQSPVLFGIPEIELDLEPQAVVVHQFFID
jgi:hypothetical protein